MSRASGAEAVPSADTLLPKTTVGFLSVTNCPDLQKHWGQTQLGKLAADRIMADFGKDNRSQIQERWGWLSERLGITMDDLDGVATGEAAFALIEPQPGEAAMAMLLDATGHAAQAQAALAKARQNLVGRGAKESRMTLGGASLYIFDLSQTKEGRTIYFLTPTFFGSCDDLAVVRDILGRLGGGRRAGSLADVTGYQMVMKRCAADAPAARPQVRWFIYPLGYVEALRAATPEEKRRRGKTVLEVVRNQGFGAVQGVGGYLDLASEGYEIIHRTAIYAPPPYRNAMKMLALPNGKDFLPQPWIPRDVSDYTTLYVDILKAFDNFDALYDEIIGEKGLWAETLQSMKDDPNGPQIDLRDELIKNLGQRITMISDYKLPITTSSERLMWAIEVKDEKAVAKAIEKCLKKDPSAKRRVVGEQVIWEIVEEEQAAVPTIQLEVPSITPEKDGAKGKKGKAGEDEEEEEQQKEGHLLPHGAITAAHGHLLVASHLDFLLKVLKPIGPADALRENPEFQRVWAMAAGRLGLKTQSARQFSRTDEELRPTYELIRQGKMPESESMLGRALNSLSGAGKRGTPRQQRINGRHLPEFELVRRFVGPGASAVASEPDGWFIKGVLLKREPARDGTAAR
jgi:hypothetical protein